MFPNKLDAIELYLRMGYHVEVDSDREVILVKVRKVGTFWNLILTIATFGAWAAVWILLFITRRKVVRITLLPSGRWGVEEKGLDAARKKALELRESRRLGNAMKALGAALVLLLAGSFVVSTTLSDERSKAIEAVTSQKIFSLASKSLGPSICSKIRESWAQDSGLQWANKYIGASANAVKKLTKWSGKEFVERNPWTQRIPESVEQFTDTTDSVIRGEFKAALEDLGHSFEVNAIQSASKTTVGELRNLTLEYCKLQQEFQVHMQSLQDFEVNISEINLVADSYPWYPKGYEEIAGFPGFAYKNKAGNPCDYGASCASFGIVSEVSCPSMLYAEVNMMDSSGAVVDWSNDTVQGLMAGQVARMAANSYADNFTRWRFTKISCY